ncbi:hypothetical protein WA026_000280 [Henosepilachna vigintioctopunctata]|uniref:DNA ligase n=1 Tax=Henosepilachna vigintioctopunctata TaxID=420089 RepID=A0AAW1V7L4_9CUCU
MSDIEEESEEKDFVVEIAKQGRATCKKCKAKCLQNELRLAKLMPNPFSSEGKMKSWFHVECLFEQFLKQRPTTKRIECITDIGGFESLPTSAQEQLSERIRKSNTDIGEKYNIKIIPKTQTPKKVSIVPNTSIVSTNNVSKETELKSIKPYPFKEFRRLVADITNVSGYLEKTQVVSDVFKTEKNGKHFEGDIYLWCKLLLPGVVKRIYNLQSKQLIKIFSRIFKSDQNKMLEHLEQGDIGETIQHFYEKSLAIKPVKKSQITVEEVDEFLEELSKLTKEEEQAAHFQSILKSCTSNDLKLIIRLVKHDLRMNAGAKHILDGVHPDAYEAYQSSRDLKSVLKQCLSFEGKPVNSNKGITAKISLLTPVLPMLAEACKSVEMAMKKCPNGMFSEIKYDGERVQVHKKGSDFKYFSRSLKPVLQHKIKHFKDYIPKAFPSGNDLILDSEILMIDINTQAPLPFGSLGKHKRDEYENACVCLFVFDCIYYNGVDLTKKPLQYRKKILNENMVEVKNHIVFSESKIIYQPSDLREMMIKVFKLGLEGLVLKDLQSIYEPGKRHWLKVKKDYLFDGAMADSADLIVLGAWYGTGKKGGKMSVFLMGCYDEKRDLFCTVTKVHTGIDDKTLEDLQEQLEMNKLSSDCKRVPEWLSCNRPMIPDFVAKNPKNQPVWEITGAEFTQHDVHTADGISIRFPRVTKMRQDKDWKTATSLKELKHLFEKSKEHTDITLLLKEDTNLSPGNNSTESNLDESLGMEKPIAGSSKCNKNQSITLNSSSDSNLNSSDNTDKKMLKRKRENSTKSKNKKRKTMEDFDHLSDVKAHYFEGVKLFLEEEVQSLYRSWGKDFRSYSGVLLEENEMNKATHVLHMNRFVKEINRNYPYDARHVIFDWIVDTVENKSLQDYQLYAVKWRPDL